MADRSIRKEFDREYFDRYYARRSSAVVTEDDIERLLRFVLSYLDYLGVRAESMLDAGCGVGLMQRAVERVRPSMRYTGIDPSEYLCAEYGWIQSSIADFKVKRPFDLVVCRDVMQYLDGDEVRAGIANLARLTRGAFYFDVPTRDDFADGLLDEKLTDGRIHVRSARWYRRILDRHFISAGGGVFIPKDSGTVVLALERG